MSLSAYQDRDTPLWQILEYMQRNRAVTIKDLEQLLGVTTTAVRQHLTTLQAEGYIERKTVHAGVGRPHHTYAISAKAQSLFACHCDDLALTLLQEMFLLEGKERTALLLERVGNRLAKKYTQSVQSTLLRERVDEMAKALYARGVLADVTKQEGDTFILQTYNCPYHELAQEHREICEMDEDMMREVLGSDVSLSACIMDGHQGCAFVVSPRANTAAARETQKSMELS